MGASKLTELCPYSGNQPGGRKNTVEEVKATLMANAQKPPHIYSWWHSVLFNEEGKSQKRLSKFRYRWS